jgi:hypothetical protein
MLADEDGLVSKCALVLQCCSFTALESDAADACHNCNRATLPRLSIERYLPGTFLIAEPIKR